MASLPESSTTICSHCDRAIPTPNFELHYAHCLRNLQRCTICGDMVPNRHADEHSVSRHAPISCSICSETVEHGLLDIHRDEKCPHRIVTCKYCEFQLPAVDLFKRQELCGNRTEQCEHCRRYVKLCDRSSHETQCYNMRNGLDVHTAGSSRDERVLPREHAARRGGHGHDISKRRIMLTMAITGIAVVMGSFILQRRSHTQQPL